MGFFGQEYWSGLPFPSPGDLPNPGIEPMSPAWQADSLPLSHLGGTLQCYTYRFSSSFFFIYAYLTAFSFFLLSHPLKNFYYILLLLFIYLAVLGSSSLARDGTLHWDCGVLATGPPGKSQHFHS